MSSKVLAKIALTIPAKEKNRDEKNNIAMVKNQLNASKNKNTYEAAYIMIAFNIERKTLPKANPNIITHVGDGEITSSSIFLNIFVVNKDDTGLLYEFIITDIIIKPGNKNKI